MLQGKGLVRLIFSLAAMVSAVSARAAEWLPVTQEELQLRSEPKAPGAPAIYLYRQVDRDDNDPDELIYARIKILTEEGRKYASIELPYLKDGESIYGIQARTIQPDGSVVNFTGTVYEKPLVKTRGVKWMAKSFALPEVQVGSIIEYRYRHLLPHGYVFDSRWLLSEDLFTRHAKFSLRPSRDFSLRWSWPVGLPPNTAPPTRDGGVIRLETHDVPPFVSEEFMPPENAMKYRVDFIYYTSRVESDPAKFWKAYGKMMYRNLQEYINERRVMEQAVMQIVQPGDSAETKLRKIYSRTQQLRNLSFERRKTEQEAHREKLKDVYDVADVWQRGYGDGLQITWLFLALVRAAGIEADPVLVATRDEYIFDQRIMNPGTLNSNIVVAKLEGREICLDPGTPFTPFGMLPWGETAVSGLRLDKDGGNWVVTPLPNSSASRIERKAILRLTSSGSLKGKVTLTYTGLEASWRRLAERNEDDTDRAQSLEDALEGDVPTGIAVKLVNKPDWSSSESPLVAEYEFEAPGWASSIGRRLLLPVGLFGGTAKHMFEHAARVHPVYFSFPNQQLDDISIELPPGWQIGTLPKEAHTAQIGKLAKYSLAVDYADGSLRLKRELALDILFIKLDFYATVRDFFQRVRAGDDDQLVVLPGEVQTRH